MKACAECPWRRKAAPGWLGSEMTPEQWVKTAHSDSIVDCHLRKDHQCVGIAHYRRNVCKMAYPPNLVVDKDKSTFFAAPAEFVSHHRSLGVVSSEME